MKNTGIFGIKFVYKMCFVFIRNVLGGFPFYVLGQYAKHMYFHAYFHACMSTQCICILCIMYP